MPPPEPVVLREPAPAKLNLALHVRRRRDDGLRHGRRGAFRRRRVAGVRGRARATLRQAVPDPVRGAELARSQIDRGADVIMQAAGGTGIGVLQAVAEAGVLDRQLCQSARVLGLVERPGQRRDCLVHARLIGVFVGVHRGAGAAPSALGQTVASSRKTFPATVASNRRAGASGSSKIVA